MLTRWFRTGLPALAALALTASVAAAPFAAAQTAEWNVARVGGPMAAPDWVIAVADTGVDPAHPTFGGRVLPAIDLVRDGRSGDPNHRGHGTHVAGIAAGGSQGPGIGVAGGARILPVRVLGPDGSGSLEAVDAGIRAAADAGAHVINLSLGEHVVVRNVQEGSSLAPAIEYAWGRGSIPVIAAGNEGLLFPFGSGFQRDLPVVVVTATGNDDRIAGYATPVGDVRWGISAPGGNGALLERRRGDDILSAVPGGGYALESGTSMAVPHVSAALAVLRARGLDPQQAVERLLATARPLGPADTYGAGLVDLVAATAGLPAPTHPRAPAPVSPAQAPTGPGVTDGSQSPAQGPAPAPTAGSPGAQQRPAPAAGAPSPPATGAATAPSGTTTTTAGAPPPVTQGAVPSPTGGEALDEREMALALPEDGPDPPSRPGTALIAVAALACAAAWVAAARLALRDGLGL